MTITLGEKKINVPFKVREIFNKYAENFETEEEFFSYLRVMLDNDETIETLLKKISSGEHFYILDNVNKVNFLMEKTEKAEITIEFCIFNRKISFIPGTKGIKISKKKGEPKSYTPIIMGDHLGLSWFK